MDQANHFEIPTDNKEKLGLLRVDEIIRKLEEEIIIEKIKAGDVGLYAQFKDTEENIFDVWETLKIREERKKGRNKARRGK